MRYLIFLVLLLSSCQYKEDTMIDYTLDTSSFLINIVRIVDNTKACKLTQRFEKPLLLYPEPVGNVYNLKTLDRDKVLAYKEIYDQVFDLWKDKSLLVKNAYEGKISYGDQIEDIRREICAPSFYFLTFGKSRYDWDFEFNEFTEEWAGQFDVANALNFSLVVLILVSLALLIMGLHKYVKKLRYLVYLYGLLYIVFVIIPVFVTSRSSRNLAMLTDQIIEIIQSSP